MDDDAIPLMLSNVLSGRSTDAPRSELVPIRLATTCREDSAAAIAAAITEMVAAFHDRNDAGPQSIRLVIFSATQDLRAAKPASAARAAGWKHAQFLCLAEMPTNDDLPYCIRALVLVERGLGAVPLRPVYINGTQSLRPDLHHG